MATRTGTSAGLGSADGGSRAPQSARSARGKRAAAARRLVARETASRARRTAGRGRLTARSGAQKRALWRGRVAAPRTASTPLAWLSKLREKGEERGRARAPRGRGET